MTSTQISYRLLLVFITFFVASCAGGAYVRPDREGATVAIIQGSQQQASGWGYDRFVPVKIDGKSVMRVFQDFVYAEVPIEAGTRSLSIHLTSHRPGRSPATYGSELPIEVTLKPKRRYAVKGFMEGSVATFWIEDAESREKASEVKVASMLAVRPTLYVPVAPGAVIPIPGRAASAP
jgi:hypothetical protein